MSIAKLVKKYISRIQPGTIFGLNDFQGISNSQAVVLELSRLSKKGAIERLTKGKYFVPKSSRFGNLGPDESQVLDDIVRSNGGYFSGVMALNRLGVTTQVPSQVTIRGARSTRKLKVGHLFIQFVSQGNHDANYWQSNLMDIIEAIRLIKKTPDGNIEDTVKKVSANLGDRSSKEISDLIRLSMNERPYVRAVLGALLEGERASEAWKVRETLNPLTKYKIGISHRILPNRENWGIS